MVLRRCRSLLGSDARAQDAMQDVFVTLLGAADRLNDQAPSALLLTMATNHCLNRLRSERRRREEAGDDLLERIAAAEDAGEDRTVARQMLGRLFGNPVDALAASTRTIAVMHLVDGLTLEEVARESGLSVSGVRKRLRTLRGRLVELEGA
jgi:RNA polymerase sigma-70 factor (ECF subfamily)